MMSALIDIIRTKASRYAQHLRSKQSLEHALYSQQQIKTRWYRSSLITVLITIGVFAFVEIVLTPGKLVRRHFAPVWTVAQALGKNTTDTKDNKNFGLPFGLQTDEQRAKQKQEEHDRVEQGLRSTHEQLDAEYQKLSQARDSIASYSQLKLKVVLDNSAYSHVPKNLVDVVASQPTAQVAWASLLRFHQSSLENLQTARRLLDSVAAHFKAGSFLTEDDRDMQASLVQLKQSNSNSIEARTCIDHIVTLQRARAALAHEPLLDDTPRNKP